MKQIIQKKIIRTVTLWMLVMTMGLSMTGCGSVAATSKSQSLDIDYVGGDGEITEDEVTAKSESPMEWLKKKLSGDKKKAGVNGREDISNYTDDTTVQDLYGVTSDSSDTKDGKNRHEDSEWKTSDHSDQPAAEIPKKDNTDGTVDIPITDDNTVEKITMDQIRTHHL